MVTVDALKLLYKKLGGTADVDNITAISDMVDLIEDVAGGGGGASGLVVYELAEDVTGNFYLDKNYNEIKAAVDNGQPVMIYSVSDESVNAYRVDINHVSYILYDAENQTTPYTVSAGEYTYGSDSATGRLYALD